MCSSTLPPHCIPLSRVLVWCRYFCFFVVLGLLLPARASACLFYDPEWSDGMRLFRQDMAPTPNASFFYSRWFGKGWDEDVEASNYAAWKAFVPGSLDADVQAFVYGSTEADIKNLLQAVTKHIPYEGPLRENAFVRSIIAHNDRELPEYMLLVKKAAAIVPPEDPWDYSAPDRTKALILLQEALEGFSRQSNEFLQLRYAFQVMRLYFNLQDHDTAIAFFETHIAPRQTLAEEKEWSRSYYAGALFHTGKKFQALQEFALIFQNSSRYRQAGYTGVQWAIPDAMNWDTGTKDMFVEALRTANSPEEKRAVHIMAAYFETQFRVQPAKSLWENGFFYTLLQQAAQTGEAPVDLPVLVGRLIDFAERNLFYDSSLKILCDDSVPTVPKQSGMETVRSVDVLLERMEPLILALWDKTSHSRQEAVLGAPVHPSFWGATAAHIAFLRGNSLEAQKRIVATRAQDPPVAIAEQLRVTAMANSAMHKPLNSETEQFFIQELTWVMGKARETTENTALQNWFKHTAHHLLGDVLSLRYALQGNVPMSLFCLSAANNIEYSRTQADVRDRQDLLGPAMQRTVGELLAAPTSPFMEFLVRNGQALNTTAFALIEGTTHLRLHNFTRAAQIFATLPPSTNERDFSPKDDWPLDGPLYVPFAEPVRAYDDRITLEQLPQLLAVPLGVTQADVQAAVPALMQNSPLGALPQPLMETVFAHAEATFNAPIMRKLDFSRAMVALETLNTLPGEVGAKAQYNYAKGLYNMGYFGKEWSLSAWSWRYEKRESKEMYTTDSPTTYTDYYRTDAAKAAFEAVVQRSTDKELQARALFMAALTTQGYSELTTRHGHLGSYVTDTPYVTTLVTDYRETEFFHAATGACSFLRDFADIMQ